MGRWTRLDEDRDDNDQQHESVHGKVRFRRYYEPGSKELSSLLRLLGAYISEGSASFPKNGRWMFSISQKDKTWLEELQQDLIHIVSGAKTSIIPTAKNIATGKPGSDMFALRSGASQLPCFFAALAGKGSKCKKIPSFVFNISTKEQQIFWNKLREGDGSVHKVTGQESYTTNSQVLAAGVSYLWDLFKLEHSIYYRDDKTAWSLNTRPAGSARNRKKTNVTTRKAQNEWVSRSPSSRREHIR